MQLKKSTLLILFTLLSILFYSSCKKNYESSSADTNSIKTSVSNWFKEINSSLSEKVKLVTDSLVRRLDYSKAKEIILPNETSLFVVKIQDESEENNYYLAFTEKERKYKTLGLIKMKGQEGTSQINTIENFAETFSLSNGETIQFNSLINLPQRKFEGLPGGKVKSFKAMPIKGSAVNNLNLNNSTGLTNRIAPDCIYYYWIVFDENTGRVYSAEYLYSECSGEGGGGGSGTYEESATSGLSDDGPLSCKSFTYKTMTSNMYEAGVSGLQFVMDVAGGGSVIHSYRTIYIGFPSTTANNTKYTAGQAAAITAAAMNRAGATMAITYFGMTTTQAAAITTNMLEAEFIALTKAFINSEISAGSTIGFGKSGTNTVTKSAVWNTGWDQFINAITNSGCK